MDKWRIDNFQRSDKAIAVVGPLRLAIDYDDVDIDAVDVLIPVLLKTLNEHFKIPKIYACMDYYGNETWEAHEGSQRYFPEPGECSICGKSLFRHLLDEEW